MPAYNFSSRTSQSLPTLAQPQQFQQLSQLGLDMVSPIDLMKNGRTPYAKNFRLYAQQSDDRQVAVSNRKGAGYYTTALGESNTVSEESDVGASTINVNNTTSIIIQSFTAANANRVTHIDIKIGNPNSASGPVLVQLWSNESGKPKTKLAESSLISIPTVADYVVARFIKTPKLIDGDTYWIIISQQDDCVGEYVLSTTTHSTGAYITNSSIVSGVAQTYSINYKVYTAADETIIDGHRLTRDNGDNITVVVIGTSLYKVDEATHKLELILTGLDSDATDYSFVHADNKLFWVNGYDPLSYWDGTSEYINSQMFTNPTIDVNSSGWTTNAFYDGTVAMTTTSPHTGAGCLSITNSTGTMAGWTAMTIENNKRYHLSFWVKVATAGTVSVQYITNTPTDAAGYDTSTAITTVSATTSWQEVDLYFTANQAAIGIQFSGAAGVGTIYLDDLSMLSTGLSYVTDPEIPIFSQITYHKDRLWGVSVTDPNKIHFCEAPGNPPYQLDNVTAELPSKQWYNSWRSIDFIYVPRPHNGSPVTAMESFQDSLFVFTEDGKYVISGYDTGSFTQRESVGFQGAISKRGVTKDENFIYFVGKDGLYRFDGTYDTKISGPIEPLFTSVSYKNKIAPIVWKNKVRFYMQSSGSSVNNTCVLWNKDLEEWEYDTDTYVSIAIPYDDANDNNKLVEISSLCTAMYIAEAAYNNLGAPIDFEYRFNYNSLGTPAQKKRINKFFPILQGVDSTFPITIAIDKDFQNSPRYKIIMLTVNGATLGDGFEFGDGTLFGGQTSFRMKKLRLSGYGYYWQMRVLRKAVNNRVAFVGAQFSYKTKRI